ncbi:MAG: hypothetical protein ACJ76H_07635 [Bacteriovoracaceae bacterium]
MLSRILLLTLMVSMNAFAADDCSPTVIDPNVLKDLSGVASKMKIECPNQINAAEFCTAVGMQLSETNPANGTRYSYQTKIYKAACVETNDSPEVIQAKIQNFWNRYHDQLVCNQLGSMVKNGNVLKLAVEKNSNEFINDTVRRWHVNLNHVDNSDHKTVLDFIDEQLAQAQGTPLEATLRRYQTLFKNNGAKNSRDL